MYHSFVSHCSASLNIGQKLLNDDSKTGKNGRKIGKYMAETKQKRLKTKELGRKIDKIWRKRGMLAMFCFWTIKLSSSFLPKCQFLFCQASQFCSAKLNIFARGGPRPPPKNAYVLECTACIKCFPSNCTFNRANLPLCIYVSRYINLYLSVRGDNLNIWN